MANSQILVVEDESVIAIDIRKSLKNLGYSVTAVAASGEEAIKKVEETKPDLVLMDIVLEGDMDGVAVAEQIKTRFDIPVVYLTSYADDDTLQRASITEPYGYILKPFEARDLHANIEIALYKHKMEKQLRESERRWFATTRKSITDGVIVTDEKGYIRFMNPIAEALTGWKQEEVLSRNLTQVFNVINEYTRAVVENPVIKAMRENVVVDSTNHILIARDGSETPIDEIASAIRDGNGDVTGGVLAFSVTTERKRAESSLRQQERLAAMGQLAGGIAHDFNNILNVIIGSVQLLQSNAAIPDSARKCLDIINQQGFRAVDLIRQILDFSRQSVSEKRPLDLIPFTKEMVKLLRRTIPENIELSFEYEPGEYWVNADTTQLQQILMNLAVNARDAMLGGGKLILRFSPFMLTSGMRPPLPGMLPGEWIRLEVSDTGVGIPPEILPQIFEPFFTTKSQDQGTGLGLAQVYGLVQQNEGHIDVESVERQGTNFIIYIPVLQKKIALPREDSERFAVGEGETILLVEDEPAVLDLVQKMLENSDYRVLTASNGQEALKVYEQHCNEIDLVLTDMVMPKMGGVELFRNLKARNPDIRVMVMSGYLIEAEDKKILQKATDAPEGLPSQGIVGFLQKPITIARLTQAVSRVIKSKDRDNLNIRISNLEV